MVIILFIAVAWLVFSFILWRGLRHFAVDEDHIFSLTFYATVWGFIAARLGFVLTHGELFSGKSVLLVAALWVAPGLSWMAGIVGATATFVLLSRQYKVRLGLVLDVLAAALPIPILIGEAGSFFTGAESGKVTGLPAVRHPVQLYEMIVLILLSILTARLTELSISRKWPFGIVGVWFYFVYAVSGFVLEFFKDSRVYWGNLTANQWILIGIFAECVGVLYIRGGGREAIRPWLTRISGFILRQREKIYEFISRKHAHRT